MPATLVFVSMAALMDAIRMRNALAAIEAAEAIEAIAARA